LLNTYLKFESFKESYKKDNKSDEKICKSYNSGMKEIVKSESLSICLFSLVVKWRNERA
jgi:hypothetical protein